MEKQNQHSNEEQLNTEKTLPEPIENKQKEEIDDSSAFVLSPLLLFLSVFTLFKYPYVSIALFATTFIITVIPYFFKNSKHNGCLFAIQIFLIFILLFFLFIIWIIVGACCGGMSM